VSQELNGKPGSQLQCLADPLYNRQVARSSRPRLKLVNLEDGMPTVPAALSRLNDLVRGARAEGWAVLKIIHGYGSSGTGGALRQSLQAALSQKASTGEIRAWIAGEDWRVSNQVAWNLINALPELRNDADLGRNNRGVSIILL